MNAPCRDFRLLLESRLTGRPAPERLVELSWHEHLFTCAECRTLLDAEEALESLLASLPEPRLAPEVRERVLARLSITRQEDGLDRLLDVVLAEAPPAGLARHVLAGLAGRSAARGTTQVAADLDSLLELDVVAAPEGLAGRTLVALRLARRAPTRRRTIWRVVVVTAAAAALAALVWITRPDSASSGVERVDYVQEPIVTPPDGASEQRRAPQVAPRATGSGTDTDVRVASGAPAVDDEVLAALDVLENWDVLFADEGEALLPTLPTADEALLDELEGEG